MIRKTHLANMLHRGDMAGVRADLDRLPTHDYRPDMSDDEIIAMLGRFGIFTDRLELWGTGTPLREFLWSEDMADATVHVMLNVTFNDVKGTDKDVRNTHINIGTGKELTIGQLAELIRQTVGYQGQIKWDASKPDGTMRKLCDVTKLHNLGWHHKVELKDGVKRLYDWYLTQNDIASR
jgi:GDP-L-fucose synthase